MTPALSAWIESPEPGISTSTTESAWSMTSTSAWPTPTVSRNTSSLPAASISSAVCSAASASPPSAPRVAIERMKTPGSRKCSVRRMRSPSSAPPRNGEDGSIESTATWRSGRAPVLDQRADQRRLAGARRAGEADDRRVAGLRIDLADERPALGVVVLDQRDAARERALVAGEQALGEGGLLIGHRAAKNTISPDGHPARTGPASRGPRRSGAPARRPAGAPALHARPRTADLRLRAADRPLGVAEAALARAAADRRAVLHRPRRHVRDRQGRAASASAAGAGSATAPRSAPTRARSRSGRRP